MASRNQRAPKTNQPKLSIKDKRAAKKAKKERVDPPVVPPGSPNRRSGGSS